MTIEDRQRVQRWWITKPIVEDAYKFNRQFKGSADEYERAMSGGDIQQEWKAS